jgi:CheY-like chemotaxis protein
MNVEKKDNGVKKRILIVDDEADVSLMNLNATSP